MKKEKTGNHQSTHPSDPSCSSCAQPGRESGFPETGRQNGLSIIIEKMTSEESGRGGKNLTIRYEFLHSPFGEILAASTDKGICYLAFSDDRDLTFGELKRLFPDARYWQADVPAHRDALSRFLSKDSYSEKIRLHLKGTDFQVGVWKTLIQIPTGQQLSYGDVAKRIGRPAACRAVGTAVGSNPISLLIPCHRVVRSSGGVGGYHWGVERKAALLRWEADGK